LSWPRFLESVSQLVADLFADHPADADPVGLSEDFQARRDIHIIAEDVALLGDHAPRLMPIRNLVHWSSGISGLIVLMDKGVELASERTASIRDVIGLALSGGGFRATAFHLGVLKRLRELGLLDRITHLSGVSGGSIAAAHWTYSAAFIGDNCSEDEAWERFERSLIRVMLVGARRFIFLFGFLFPATVFGAAAAAGVWLWVEPSLTSITILLGVIPAFGYLVWHYSASRFLEAFYEKRLFGKAKLGELAPSNRDFPLLFLNATTLNMGHHLLFATKPIDVSSVGLLPAKIRRTSSRYALHRGMPCIPMPLDTSVAKAVAASSAFPGVFAPLRFGHVLDHVLNLPWERKDKEALWGKSAIDGNFHVIDGGVFDNQGTDMLVDVCHHLIISDGAAALKEDLSPSSWQLWPPGRGVFFRSQAIIYVRLRELGYRRLEDRQKSFKTLQTFGICYDRLEDFERERKQTFLKSYSYIELLTPDHFPWQTKKQRLPSELIPLVANIRTDLDSFSEVEIAALMFHGYTLIDHCLSAFQPHLLPETSPPLKFSLKEEFTHWGEFWDNPSDHEIARVAGHLSVSGSRSRVWRWFGRLLREIVFGWRSSREEDPSASWRG